MEITLNDLREIVAESVKRVLKENIEESIDKKIIDLISFLHNGQKPLREIHWNTRENALHLTTDETMDDMFEWEDTLGEAFINGRDIKVKINETRPSSEEDFDSIMKELISLGSDVKESISGNKDYDSINAVLDEIIEGANKHLYRGQFN